MNSNILNVLEKQLFDNAIQLHIIVRSDSTVSATAKFDNMGILLLFDEIRYELNGIPVDRTLIMKNYCLLIRSIAASCRMPVAVSTITLPMPTVISTYKSF